MSAKKATEQAVFAAADQLWASGEEPSYESVISLTGGSTETVGPYLKTWLARPRAAKVPTPDSIAVQGRVFLASVWTSALKQAHAELEQQRKDASADAVLAREELAHAMEQLLELARRRDDVTHECDRLRDERALAQAEVLRCAGLQVSLAAVTAERDSVMRDLDRLKGEANSNERHIASLMLRFTPQKAAKPTTRSTRMRPRSGQDPRRPKG